MFCFYSHEKCTKCCVEVEYEMLPRFHDESLMQKMTTRDAVRLNPISVSNTTFDLSLLPLTFH